MTKKLTQEEIVEVEKLLEVSIHITKFNADLLKRQVESRYEHLTIDSPRMAFSDALLSINKMEAEIAKMKEHLTTIIEVFKRIGR